MSDARVTAGATAAEEEVRTELDDLDVRVEHALERHPDFGCDVDEENEARPAFRVAREGRARVGGVAANGEKRGRGAEG